MFTLYQVENIEKLTRILDSFQGDVTIVTKNGSRWGWRDNKKLLLEQMESALAEKDGKIVLKPEDEHDWYELVRKMVYAGIC